MREIGDTSVFAMTGEDGVTRAFLNVCRHRGSRLVEDVEGQVRRRIQCPYHAWSYDLEGKLVAAPHMNEVEDFDKACWGLLEVRSAVVGGLLLIDLSGEAPDPAEHVGDLARVRSIATGSPSCRRRRGTVYEVEANWKGIAENYNECLHCPGVHPELNALSDYRSGEEVDGEGSWCGGSMTLNEEAETMGHGRRPRHRAAADPRADRDGHQLGLLLRAVPERARLAASRLLHAAHPLAPIQRPHRGHVRVVLRAGDDRPARTSTPVTPSTSGTWSTARTGTSAS